MNEAYKEVGVFTEKIVLLLNLPVPANTEIFLSESTIKHINKRHPDVNEFISRISNILHKPDYVGYSKRKKTVDFIVTDDIRLRVPVRPSKDGIHFVRSLFKLHKRDFERLKRNKSIIPVIVEEKKTGNKPVFFM